MKQNVQMEMQNIPLQSVESHWLRIFNKYDVNKIGKVPLSELCIAVRGSNPDHIPAHTVNKILKKYDTDQDGYISFSEFLVMLENDDGKSLFHGWMTKYIHHTIPRRNRVRGARTVPDGEYEDAYSCFPPPVGMLLASLIEIAFFSYDLMTDHSNYVDGPTATLFIYNPKRRKEAWRFFTYMFVHIGPFHLIVNLLVQILLGIPLEMVHGWYRVLIIYLSGVVAGSLGTSVTDPYVFLAGASGGVYAIIAAHLATIIMNWSEMQFAFLQLLVFLLITVTDVGTAIYQRYVLNIDGQIGYVAHFTGALAGLLLGLRVLRNLEVHSWEKTIYRIALIIYFVLMFGAILWNILFPQYFPTQTV